MPHSLYQTIRRIGTGTDADVLLVRRTTDGRTFAMKLAHPAKRSVRAVKMEYKLLSDLDHPNLIFAYGMVELDGRPGMVTEHFPGTDLRRAMHSDRRRLVRHFGYIVEQCGDVISYLHDHGIYHGDVKPENILVAPGGRVRLIDFSIAAGGIWGWFKSSQLAGTPNYMAPELIRSRRATAKSDLYALGVICYELISGRAPFDGASKEEIIEKQLRARPHALRHFRGGIDARVERLVMQALAKEPEARPADCRTFGRRLSRMLGSPLEAPELLGLT